MKEKLIDSMKYFFQAVLALLLFIMFCLVFTNVILRYGFDSSIAWCDEAARYIFVWIIFIGALVAYEENAHLGVDVVVQKLSERGKKILFIINNLIILIVLSLIIVGSWKYILVTVDQNSPALDIPLAIVYASGFVSAIGMAFLTVNNLYLLITNKISSGKLVLVGSEEQAKVEEVLSDSSNKGGKKL